MMNGRVCRRLLCDRDRNQYAADSTRRNLSQSSGNFDLEYSMSLTAGTNNHGYRESRSVWKHEDKMDGCGSRKESQEGESWAFARIVGIEIEGSISLCGVCRI